MSNSDEERVKKRWLYRPEVKKTYYTRKCFHDVKIVFA